MRTWSTGSDRAFPIILISGVLAIGASLTCTLLVILTAEFQLVMRPQLSDLANYPFKSGKTSITRKYIRGFYRPCASFRNCSFTPDTTTLGIQQGHINYDDPLTPFGETDTVYLACEKEQCLCQEHWGLAYKWNQRDWSLSWDIHDLTCTISKGGPCGIQNGLRVKCPLNIECLDGRCRDRSKMGRGQLEEYCDDDMDCDPKFSCLYPLAHMPTGTKRCAPPPSALRETGY